MACVFVVGIVAEGFFVGINRCRCFLLLNERIASVVSGIAAFFRCLRKLLRRLELPGGFFKFTLRKCAIARIVAGYIAVAEVLRFADEAICGTVSAFAVGSVGFGKQFALFACELSIGAEGAQNKQAEGQELLDVVEWMTYAIRHGVFHFRVPISACKAISTKAAPAKK